MKAKTVLERCSTWGALGGRQDQVLLPGGGMALDESPQVSSSQCNVQHRVHAVLWLENEPVGVVPLQNQLCGQQIHLHHPEIQDPRAALWRHHPLVEELSTKSVADIP